MRILLTGGGTAGHINPAIAIGDIIKSHDTNANIAFVGTPTGMENKLVAEAGYPIYHVTVSGFSRSLSPKNLHAAWLALSSPHQAQKILSSFRPDMVIGTGGYVSWPLLKAASRAGIPTVLHESNVSLGLTAKRLAPHMDAIWLNFKETANMLPQGCVPPTHTGNPLRATFSRITRKEARTILKLTEDQVFMLSFGGSRGAEPINRCLIDFMTQEAPHIPQLVCLHATGEQHYTHWSATHKNTKYTKIVPYIENMALCMAAADIVVCRAGAVTISELAMCGKCAILIPSPYVTDNHQYKNAQALASKNAVLLLEERDLPENKFSFFAKMLIFEQKKREGFENAICQFVKKDTNTIIWNQIQLLRQKTRAENQRK